MFLSVTNSRFSTHERIPVYRSNELSSTLWVPPSCCTKIYSSLVPWQTSQTYAKKCVGQKQYLAGEVGGKVFNLTLMNKLIRIEWVSECHKTANEAHGYDVISMSKNETFLIDLWVEYNDKLESNQNQKYWVTIQEHLNKRFKLSWSVAQIQWEICYLKEQFAKANDKLNKLNTQKQKKQPIFW